MLIGPFLNGLLNVAVLVSLRRLHSHFYVTLVPAFVRRWCSARTSLRLQQAEEALVDLDTAIESGEVEISEDLLRMFHGLRDDAARMVEFQPAESRRASGRLRKVCRALSSGSRGGERA